MFQVMWTRHLQLIYLVLVTKPDCKNTMCSTHCSRFIEHSVCSGNYWYASARFLFYLSCLKISQTNGESDITACKPPKSKVSNTNKETTWLNKFSKRILCVNTLNLVNYSVGINYHMPELLTLMNRLYRSKPCFTVQ